MRTVVLGDIHLHKGSTHAAAKAVGTVVHHYLQDGPFRLVLSGDVYDLAVAGSRPLRERLEAIDKDQPEFHDALVHLVQQGGEVVYVPGNHDFEMMSDEGRQWFESRVPGGKVTPWFHRVGKAVHIEHGNQYDPDNSHPHPLTPHGDPLGIMLSRQIMARLGDMRLLNLNDRTPLPMLFHCFVFYGMKTPGLVARYCWLGCLGMLRGDRGVKTAREMGEGQARERSEAMGVEVDEIHRLAQLSASPTHAERMGIFRRMYLDRMLLGFLLIVSLIVMAARYSQKGLEQGSVALLLASTFMLVVAALMPNRYRGKTSERLKLAARRIIETSGVRYVIFGHAHDTHNDGSYVNTGSFGFAARDGRRSFVEVNDTGIGGHIVSHTHHFPDGRIVRDSELSPAQHTRRKPQPRLRRSSHRRRTRAPHHH